MPLYKSDSVSRTIGVEEHFATPALLAGPGRWLAKSGFTGPLEELLDIGRARIAAMDAAGVDVAVLSLSAPGVEPLDAADAIALARDTNDLLAAATEEYPDRFAGLAALPLSAPDTAADELERTVREYRFTGAMINGHSQGRYLDDEFFLPILAKAQELCVPLYLHPTPPPQPVIKASYTGNFPPEVSFRLATAGWGWHHETGTHALRLVLGGAFDRFPHLQIMIGHHGEVLPFLLPRIERSFPAHVTGLKRPIRAYLRENFYYTFGGWNWSSMFSALRRLVDVDRIMFATDYPYGSMEEACSFLSQLEVSEPERELIAHGNAERILGLQAQVTGTRG
jgi:predicted TIM-barrel fold metal-dependent hydrolase